MIPLGRTRRRGQRSLSLILLSYSSWTGAQDAPTIAGFPSCISPWNLKDVNGHVPCQTLQEQMTLCTGAAYTVPSINIQSLGLYPAPTDSSSISFPCECTEAIYNLFQACAACQNATDLSSRQAWFKSCPTSLSDIPIKTGNMTDNTFWIDQVYNPAFNLTLALQSAQSSQPPPDNDPSSSASSSGPGSDDDGSDSPNIAASSKSKSPNVGMIVGIVVGLLIFLLILALVGFFLLKRKRSRTAPSAEFMKYAQPNTATIPLTQTTLDEESSHHMNSLVSQINNNPKASMSRGDTGTTEDSERPPSFTPGLFKDPIFEKGAALNIANNAGFTAVSGGSPVTYSPATPSEQQRLLLTYPQISSGGVSGSPVTYSPATATSLMNPDHQRLMQPQPPSSTAELKKGSL